MDSLELMIELFRPLRRLGPGSEKIFDLTVMSLQKLDKRLEEDSLAVADLGCGTGVSSLLLGSRLMNGRITAIDNSAPLIAEVQRRAEVAGLTDRITPLQASMDDLPFEPASLDLIWSEGAIYNIGFKAGLAYWRQFLKPGGLVVVSDLVWTTPNPPENIRTYWLEQYPDIGTPQQRLEQTYEVGLMPFAHFLLPQECWSEHYYAPLQERMVEFALKYEGNPAATALVAEQRKEIEQHRLYGDTFTYGMIVARKPS